VASSIEITPLSTEILHQVLSFFDLAMTLIVDLAHLYSNSHSHVAYLCQVSLNGKGKGKCGFV